MFHDDLVRLRSGHRPGHMAAIRHCAMKLVQAAGDKHCLKVRRRKADPDPACIVKLIAAAHPST